MELKVERIGVSFIKSVMIIGAGLSVCQSGEVLGLSFLGHIYPLFFHLLYFLSLEFLFLLFPLGLVSFLGHLFKDPLELLNLLRAILFLDASF